MSLMSDYPQFTVFFQHKFGDLYHDPDQQHLIKKTEVPQQTDLARQIISSFKHRRSKPPVLAPHHIHLEGNTLVQVFENCKDRFLAELAPRPVDIRTFLDYGCAITMALVQLHKQGTVHKDLCPFNILVSPNGDHARLTGVFPTNKPLKVPLNSSPFESVSSRYLYAAPEQTGRTPHQVCFGSDLYSLGVVFYELLSGHPPFPLGDPLELIHHHITVLPPKELHDNPEIPETIAKIIDKLLEKSPEDRYQNAAILHGDFLRCRRSWEREGQIPDLSLDQENKQPKFRLPRRLYGVQEQQRSLNDSFLKVAAGAVSVVQVKGDAGLGKSSLVTLLQDTVKSKGGLIVSGRFEKQHQDTPYRCLREALGQLVNHLLTKDEKLTYRWKKMIPDELGENLPVLLGLLPDLKLLIPSTGEPTKLDPVETQSRMGHCLQQFVGCFSKLGVPLVLFFDNFHFADSATLLALQELITDVNCQHILLLAALRDQVTSHKVRKNSFWEQIEKSEIQVLEIRVHPWTKEELNALLKDSFRSDQNFEDLSELLKNKTDGNPYYAKQLLSHWVEKAVVFWDNGSQRWSWKIEDLHRASQSNDVVDLLVSQIKLLPEKSINALKWASCIGAHFDPKTLALALEVPLDELVRCLEELQNNGLIFQETDLTTGEKRFHFLHNRIHLAAQSFWEINEKKRAHLKIGWTMEHHPPQLAHNDWIIQTVNQLNQAIELINLQPDRLLIAKRNLQAGNATREMAAFETAWGYYTQGMELLGANSWETDYQLTKDLYVHRAEAEYFTGNTETFVPIFQLLYDNLKTDEEREEVINIKLNLYTKAGDFKKAVDIGIAAINQFSPEKIPPNLSEISVIAQVSMQDLRVRLTNPQLEGLTALEPMEDPAQIALIKLMSNLMPAAFISRQPLWIYLTVKMVEASLKHGVCLHSINGFMSYAVLLCSGFEDYQQGYLAGKMALELDRKFKEPSQTATLNFLFGAYISHWKQPSKESLEILIHSAEQGIRSGNFIAASDALSFWSVNLISAGTALDSLDLELRKYQKFAKQSQNTDLSCTFDVIRFYLSLLETNTEGPLDILSGDLQIYEQLLKSRNQRPLQGYYFALAQLNYLFGNVEAALAWILKSDHTLRNYGQLSVTEHYFYYSLIVMANYPSMSLDDRKQYWDILKVNREKLLKLAQACPINFQAQYLLVCAEMSKESGNFIETIDLYDKAIEASHNQEQVQITGLANELAARYYLSKRKSTIAAAYFKEAFGAYRKWGASAKLSWLQKEFAGLIELPALADSTYQPNSSNDSFDLASLSRILQAISSETDTAALVQKVLKVLMENAGAQKGYFLVAKDGHFQVQAEGDSNSKPTVKRCAYLWEESNAYAHSVISFVIRTRKKVYLENAISESTFGHDSYIRQAKPKSILALPIQVHGRMLGILYLENNLQTQAFSAKSIEVLTLLISQVSISFENSNLFSHLSQTTLELKQAKRELKAKISRLEQQIKTLKIQ